MPRRPRKGWIETMGKTHIIAVAGKGGVGKTTTCGMLIDYLCKAGKGPLLVVDADANSNLNEVLGVEVENHAGRHSRGDGPGGEKRHRAAQHDKGGLRRNEVQLRAGGGGRL